jgi:uncharacterized protein (DUF2267 family)
MITRASDEMEDNERFDRRYTGRTENASDFMPIGARQRRRTETGVDFTDYDYRQRHQNQRNRMETMNFERYAQEANHFINEVADELQTDNRHKAARITRAVLQAIRDRLIPDEAVQFGQALPMALKAVYFDQYDISKTPVRIRRQVDFINFIRSKDRLAEIEDFPTQDDVVDGLQAVFTVLENHLDPGHIIKVKNMLPEAIVDMIGY